MCSVKTCCIHFCAQRFIIIIWYANGGLCIAHLTTWMWNYQAGLDEWAYAIAFLVSVYIV